MENSKGINHQNPFKQVFFTSPMAKKKAKIKEEPEEKDYPEEEQGILPEETSEEIEEEMETGEKEADVYSEEGLEKLEEDDEIEPWEEGFMEGAKDGGQLAKDALTGKPLMGEETIELKIDGKRYRFVNKENAEKFKKKLKKKEKK